MKRIVRLARLRSECLEEYKDCHANIPSELEAAYRRAGINRISCFLHGNLLVIYSEQEEDSSGEPDESDKELLDGWQKLVKPMADSEFEGLEFEEVYALVPPEQHLVLTQAIG